MKKHVFCLLLFFALIISRIHAQTAGEMNVKFLNSVENKNWDEAEALFAPIVKQQVSSSALKNIFDGISLKIGDLLSFTPVNAKPNVKNTLNYIGTFKSTQLTIQISSDSLARITGFHFLPLSELYHLPPYADETKYKIETSVLVADNIKLPANITIPVDASQKFPIVILVGGSGPSDLDESIGADKPFKDLSIGLALNGVATLRFDKRTFVYNSINAKITINEEYLLDVKTAIKFAKTIPGADTARIFILGHSLGGMLAPLILKDNPSLAGAILLEANARPLEDLIYEQTVHLYKIQNVTDKQEELKTLYNATREIKGITEKDSDTQYLNIKGSYWLSLNRYKPLQVAAGLGREKMLIVQGGDDYQVTKTDFGLWSETLNKNKNVTFKFYPLINHAMVEGKGTFSPDEYLEPLNAPLYLSNDIAAWIKSVSQN